MTAAHNRWQFCIGYHRVCSNGNTSKSFISAYGFIIANRISTTLCTGVRTGVGGDTEAV